MGTADTVKLHYNPEWLTLPTGVEALRHLIAGVQSFILEEEHRKARELLSYAASIGITVVQGIPEVLGPNDYVLEGPWMSTQEEHEIIRNTSPQTCLPKTLGFEAYDSAPFLPVVAKETEGSGGTHKYLIETPEQWRKLRTLLTSSGPLRAPAADDDPWYEKPYGNYDFTDLLYFQQYIQTPSRHNTSIRTLVTASGERIASSLQYSIREDTAKLPDYDVPIEQAGWGGKPLNYLTHPESLVYLGARDITSNLAQGAGSIVLDRSPRSKPIAPEEAAILEAHGLDPEYPRLPAELARQSELIGRTVGRKKSIIVGIDWLPEKDSDSFWYLEANAKPGLGAFLDRYYWGMELGTAQVVEIFEEKLAQLALWSLLRS